MSMLGKSCGAATPDHLLACGAGSGHVTGSGRPIERRASGLRLLAELRMKGSIGGCEPCRHSVTLGAR